MGHLYSLGLSDLSGKSKRESAKKSLDQYEIAVSLDSSTDHKYSLFEDMSMMAFESGDLSKAKQYASELLKLATQVKKDWNYGNAIHKSNLILGRVALASGDTESAKKYLIAAGKTKGSPQLNSFGPNMTLAKELLEMGEKDIVIQYFGLCDKFWDMGHEQLKTWTQKVKEGKVPDFGANLDY